MTARRRLPICRIDLLRPADPAFRVGLNRYPNEPPIGVYAVWRGRGIGFRGSTWAVDGRPPGGLYAVPAEHSPGTAYERRFFGSADDPPVTRPGSLPAPAQEVPRVGSQRRGGPGPAARAVRVRRVGLRLPDLRGRGIRQDRCPPGQAMTRTESP